METLKEVFKQVVFLFAFLFFLSGLDYHLIQIERSDIVELRHCPHCGVKLLR